MVGVDILATSVYGQLTAFREGLLRVQLPEESNSYEKAKWQFLTYLSLSGDEGFNLKATTSEKTNKCHVHHNWELSGVLVMLPQLSCLLYGFHVKEVSPKYCLLSTTCYKMSPRFTIHCSLCHHPHFMIFNTVEFMEFMSSNMILQKSCPQILQYSDFMYPNFMIL